jgi:hypothetical protein
MWNLECTIIPVITGATGTVIRSLRKNLEAIPGKHSIDSLQQTAILWTSHIIRKVLQCETWSESGGGHRWFKGSTGKKRPVTSDNENNNNHHHHQSWSNQCFKLRPIIIFILKASQWIFFRRRLGHDAHKAASVFTKHLQVTVCSVLISAQK